MKQWITGMDISSLLEVEEHGGTFYENGTQKDLISILKEQGTSLIRLRLWNDPYDASKKPYLGGTNDLERTLLLAKRVQNKGLNWMLDIHYSDHWSDPGKQRLPKAWENLSFEALVDEVYRFTGETLNRCKENDVVPAIVAIGNELTHGLLWPYGKTPNWKNIAILLSAGLKAVHDFDETIETVIHLDNGGNRPMYEEWFDHWFENATEDFTYIGLSYYPFWHGTLKDLKENMNACAKRYRKDMLVCEVSTAFTMKDYQEYEKLPNHLRKGMATKKETAEKLPYALTPKGQAEFMLDFMKTVSEVQGHHGRGFIYWEPAWLPVEGSEWASEEAITYLKEKGPGGNEWANQALFDYDGNMLEALHVIHDFDKKMNRKGTE